MTEIPIIVGDPDSGPASYTRFVLPFAYEPVPLEPTEEHLYYRPSQPPTPQRRLYLTPETADVLFHRAAWFTLDAENPFPKFEAHFDGGRNLTMEMKTPQLVLFEAAQAFRRREVDDPRSEGGPGEPDILYSGFLLVDVSFKEGQSVTLGNLLELNERFRFVLSPYPAHATATKKLLASYPEVDASSEKSFYFERWAALLRYPLQDQNRNLWRIARKKHFDQAERWASGEEDRNPGWFAYPDNRAYVWTCSVLDGGAQQLARSQSPDLDPKIKPPEQYGHWIKLLNVDAPDSTVDKTDEASDFERKWARKHTYYRWAESGTFYGFSAHAGAVLAPVLGPPIWQHFRDMYFDQTLLLLYLRVSTFRFSRTLSEVSASVRDAGAGGSSRRDWERSLKKFSWLRWTFAQFVNLYQFPLLSCQQQALEMFTINRKQMEVDELFEEVTDEVDATDKFLRTRVQLDQAYTTERLTVALFIAAALTLGATLPGLDVEKGLFKGWLPWVAFTVVSGASLVVLLLLASILKSIGRRPGWEEDES